MSGGSSVGGSARESEQIIFRVMKRFNWYKSVSSACGSARADPHSLSFPPFRGIDNTTPCNSIAPARATIPLVNFCDTAVELFDL